MKEEGVHQNALDAAATKGFGNALFEYDEDETTEVVEEFYPNQKNGEESPNSAVISKLKGDIERVRSVSS